MSIVSDIGIPGLTQQGILQPKLNNRWRVTFASLGTGSSQPVSVQAIQISRPTVTLEEVQLDRYNSRAWIGSKYTFEPCTLVVEDDVTGTATVALQNQLQKQQWLLGAEGPYLQAAGDGSLYKFQMQLDELDGGQQVVESWVYQGCWLKAMNFGELNYAEGKAITISLTIRYDLVNQIVEGYTGGSGIAAGTI